MGVRLVVGSDQGWITFPPQTNRSRVVWDQTETTSSKGSWLFWFVDEYDHCVQICPNKSRQGEKPIRVRFNRTKSATEWWIYDQLVQHLGGVETTLVFWRRREKVVSTIRISPLESMLLGCFQHFAFLVSDNYPVRPRCVGSNMLTENPNVISINITLKNNQHSSFKRLVWSTGKS